MKPVRILYGVQGTGNGHLSRARLLAREFALLDCRVDYLFSGRDRADYFDMEPFGNARFFKGLSFSTTRGRLNKLATLGSGYPLEFLRDIRALDLSAYDVVITDFEPISAWAARRQGIPCVGVGHQYALGPKTPMPAGDPVARLLLKHYAPADIYLGLHWFPFASDTLPPLIDTRLEPAACPDDVTLVYLPFECLGETLYWLRNLINHSFIVYSPAIDEAWDDANLKMRPLSQSGFRRDLCRCSRVICNSGFELISEALHLGLPILTKPLHMQFEQLANVAALRNRHLAEIATELNSETIGRFIRFARPQVRHRWPDVATAIASALAKGFDTLEPTAIAAQLWADAGIFEAQAA